MNDMFDDALSKLGITAKTTICSMTLNEEDAKGLSERSERDFALEVSDEHRVGEESPTRFFCLHMKY